MDTQEKQNVRIVKKLYEEAAAGNKEKCKEYFHPDVMIYEAPSMPYGGSWRGFDGWLRLLDEELKAYDDMSYMVEEYMAGGDWVAVLIHWTVRGKKTGKIASFPATELFRLRDGKVIEMRMFYYDTKRASEVFGE